MHSNIEINIAIKHELFTVSEKIALSTHCTTDHGKYYAKEKDQLYTDS
jgi:hypothetical protein